MSLNLQHIVIGIGGVIGGAIVNQHWNTTILPGIGRAWTGISTLAAQRPELAIGIPAAIGVACAIYKLCGGYLIQKLAPSAPKGPEIINPLPTLTSNFKTLTENTARLENLKEKLSLALSQATEIDLHRKLEELIKEAKKESCLSLEEKLRSAKEGDTEKKVREKLQQIQKELSDINTELTKSLAKNGNFFIENPFTVGSEGVAFMVNLSTDPTVSGYYRLSKAKSIRANDVTYDYQMQSSDGLASILFDRTGLPYMNKAGQVATLSRSIVWGRDFGASSLEPHKKSGTVYGLKESYPLPEEKPAYFGVIRKISRQLSQFIYSEAAIPSAASMASPLADASVAASSDDPSPPTNNQASPKMKKGLVQQLRRLFARSDK